MYKNKYQHKNEKGVEYFFIFLAAVAAIYVVLVIIRMFHFYNLDKTNGAGGEDTQHKTHNGRCDGEESSIGPGRRPIKTIAGIDANKNGIRGDMELAIFKQYPDSAKTRAVLLQYALAFTDGGDTASGE